MGRLAAGFMKTGLTLGKYAPLHQGHQLVIETALAQVDRLIVLVYGAAEVTTVPLAVRAGWIRRLYPQAEVIEACDGPTTVGATPEIMRVHDEYLRRVLQGRRVTHFFSSEFYGAHVSRALGAADCRVDETRTRVPVSGTAIRRDLFRHRRFVPQEVYWDLLVKAVFLGAPSTGKTTLAAALARQLGTAWVPEYGREYWDQHQRGRRLEPEQLVEIAEGHRAREEAIARDADRYLFVDTDATTTCMFARYYHGAALPRLAALADEARQRYDLFFLCGDEIPYAATWDRSGPVQRTEFQQQTRADLDRRGTPYILLTGPLPERMATVAAALAGVRRF